MSAVQPHSHQVEAVGGGLLNTLKKLTKCNTSTESYNLEAAQIKKIKGKKIKKQS